LPPRLFAFRFAILLVSKLKGVDAAAQFKVTGDGKDAEYTWNAAVVTWGGGAVFPLGGPKVTGANVPLEYAAPLEDEPLPGAGGITIWVMPRRTRPETKLVIATKTSNDWYMAKRYIWEYKRDFFVLRLLSPWGYSGGGGCAFLNILAMD